MGRLFGIAYIKFHIVSTFQGRKSVLIVCVVSLVIVVLIKNLFTAWWQVKKKLSGSHTGRSNKNKKQTSQVQEKGSMANACISRLK